MRANALRQWLLCLALMAGVVGRAIPAHGQGTLEIHILDVGQADAVFLRCPDGNHELLIDAGDTRYQDSAKRFKVYFGRQQKRENDIEVVVASHPHADHIGSMDWVLKRYVVQLYVDNGLTHRSTIFDRFEVAWEESEAAYGNPFDAPLPLVDFCPDPDVEAKLVVPTRFGDDEDPNNNSVIVRVDYRGDSFLFVGDAEDAEERLLLDDPATRALLDCDFLKVGHHGSDTSSAAPFLAAVSPEIAVISCGAKDVSTNKGYRHPRADVVRRLHGAVSDDRPSPRHLEAYDRSTGHWTTIALSKAVFATVVDGDMVFESTGQGIRLRSP